MVTNSETTKTGGDLYDLPFLDLHYFNTFSNVQSSVHHGTYDVRSDGFRHGQALDLAQSSLSNSSSFILDMMQKTQGKPFSMLNTTQHRNDGRF